MLQSRKFKSNLWGPTHLAELDLEPDVERAYRVPNSGNQETYVAPITIVVGPSLAFEPFTFGYTYWTKQFGMPFRGSF